MAKKKLRTLDDTRARALLGFDKVVALLMDFQPEIVIRTAAPGYFDPVEVEHSPLYLEICLDRKNRELRRIWHKEGHHVSVGSQALVTVGIFHKGVSGDYREVSQFLADILIKSVDNWREYDDKRKILRHECQESDAWDIEYYVDKHSPARPSIYVHGPGKK